jgi:hypothetical protein
MAPRPDLRPRSRESAWKKKAALSGPVWYQLYLVGGRDVASASIERSRRAGFSALVVTIDTCTTKTQGRFPLCGLNCLRAWSILLRSPLKGWSPMPATPPQVPYPPIPTQILDFTDDAID